MDTAYASLSEPIRHGIAHTLGWRELRPVQVESIEAVASGSNAIILAPTAGGKTEAAVLPVVDALVRERVGPVAVLYMSPLRALLNNQEDRLQRLAGLAGLGAFKWHGDVDRAAKLRFVDDPAHLLLITPESLEVMLATARYDKARLFGDLRFVVIDEIHAFAGDDRGDHLVAVLERVAQYSRHDVQRIGLSATVANPDVLLQWLQGSSKRPGRVVAPAGERPPRLVEIHPLSGDEDPSLIAARLAVGRKSLLFSESRGKTERLKRAIEDRGVRAFVHHASLSRELREDTERAFRSASDCCIVCTRSLELGLDVGDLDLVMQLDAPSTVSSMLQRLGRTGRRPGTQGRIAFLTDDEWSFIQAIAMVRLAARGFVEPVRPSRRAVHVYVHQVLARILQQSGVTPHRLVEGVGNPYCFSDLSVEDRLSVLEHLDSTDILTRVDGLLTFGEAGEKRFGYANFRDLYSVFDTPQAVWVRTTTNRDIGWLEVWFAQAMRQEEFLFVLGGSAWQAVECDWERNVLIVKPAPRGKFPSWMGTPTLLSRELCEEMRSVLVEEEPVPFLTDSAQSVLERRRLEWGDVLRASRLVLQRKGNDVYLHTFAGGRINNVLAMVLKREFALDASLSNFSLRVSLPDARSWQAPLLRTLESAASASYFTPEVISDLTAALPRGRLSKFQPYLPKEAETSFLAERVLDMLGARQVAGLHATAFSEETLS